MLLLQEIELQNWRFGPLGIFSTADKARKHLSDHLLTRPEAQYWAQVIPSYSQWLDPRDDDALFRFAKGLWSNRADEEATQGLYDGYASAIGQGIRDALEQGWYWVENEADGPCWRGIGLSGVYVIWLRSVVRTGMLIGYASPPDADETATARRKSNPLPRQNTWIYRGAKLRHDQTHYPPPAKDVLSSRYQLFKKCAVRVRREFKDACRTRQVLVSEGGLGDLRDGVPDASAWQRLYSNTMAQQTSCPPNAALA